MKGMRPLDRTFERLTFEDAARLRKAADGGDMICSDLIHWADHEIAYGGREATTVLLDALLEMQRRCEVVEKAARDLAKLSPPPLLIFKT